MVGYFENTGARITFLANALGLPLHSAAQVEEALECDEACARASAREARMREELRALLVMRYRAVTRLAQNVQVGAPAARDILLTASDRLQRRGFDAQAPGVNLRSQFETLQD